MPKSFLVTNQLAGALFISLISIFAEAATARCPDYKIPRNAPENKKLEVFLKSSWDDFMNDRPEWAYDLGYKNLGDRWSDDSFEAIEVRKNKVDCLQSAIKQINRSKLSPANQVNYDIFSQEIEMGLKSKKFPNQFLVLNQLGGVHTDIVDTLLYMPQNNMAEIQNILKRLELIPQKVEQQQKLLEEGIKQGVTAPQAVINKIPEQFDTILTKRVQDSVLYRPFTDLKALDENSRAEVRAKALQLIESKALPALANFKKFVVETYIPKARLTTSIQDLPMGAEWYQWRIKNQTTTDLTAEQIHQLGLNEVARILKEMEEVKKKAGFKKDLKAFNEFLLNDPQFYYSKPEELMRDYRDIAKRIDPVLPQLFKTLPRLPYGVREIPAFKAKSSPTAYYYPGSLSSGRAGYFEANTYDLKARPKWGMEALTIHEAVPGHHLQISIAQEVGELPDFRKYDGYTAFVEGWALYSEALGEDMGFYKDPYSKYGQLTYEMWRAVRLVVDTGLHSKGWTRDQALKYFMDHMPKSRLESEVEVDRYIVWPGQALAYKVGQLKFLELRERAKAELKDKFDIREFHDVALSGGALPLTLLEARILDWIKKQKNSEQKKSEKKRH